MKDLFSLLRKHFAAIEHIKLSLIEIHEFNCQDLFRFMDQGRQGYLTLSVLRSCLEKLQILPNPTALFLLFRRCDVRREGRLDQEALQDMMTPINSIYENYLNMKRPQFPLSAKAVSLPDEVRTLLKRLFEESLRQETKIEKVRRKIQLHDHLDCAHLFSLFNTDTN